MKWDTQSPCGSCPYRKDAPLGLWHPAEFDNLAESERNQIGTIFGCHATRKRPEASVCAGWLLKQRDAGFPSLRLRMAFIRSAEAVALLETVNDGGHELYGSVDEMIAANEALGRCECGRYLTTNGPCGACR